MPRLRSIPLCLAILALVCAWPARAANENPWLELHSAHFTVITDAGEKRGHEVAFRFEQMRAVFGGLLSKERLHESVPLTILALENDKSYYQAAPLHQGQPIDVPAFLVTGEDQSFIVLNMSESEPWRDIAHDFAHMLLTYNYPPAQAWFDEGLCEYFSSIRADNKQVELGAEPPFPPAARDLLASLHSGQPPKSLTELLSTQDWLSIPELFSMKPVSSVSPGNEIPRAMFYAQSWMVMHYLVHEKKMPETGTYLGLVLAQHVPVEDAIKQAYSMSAAQLDQAVKDYFHTQIVSSTAASTGKTTPPSTVSIDRSPSPVAPDTTITARPIPEADEQAIYAGIQIRVPERRELGLKTLQNLAATPTEADKKAEVKTNKRTGEEPQDSDRLPSSAQGNQIAHRILGWDHIQHGEFEEAFRELGDAASLNQHDMWVRYYLSLAKYRVGESKNGIIPGVANMMLDLKAVLDWNPDMADAYDLLAMARNAGGTAVAAMQAERAAMNLSPREERYSLHLAQIYVTGKKWEAAGALLDRLKASSDPKIAAAASELLTQAASERRFGIPGSTGAPQAKYEPQKTPFDVLDQDAAKRAAAENSDQTNLDVAKRVTKFANGRLISVDCSQAPAALLTVSSESGTLKLRVADYKSLVLIGADDFSCDWRDRRVTVNYKPGTGKEGELVSLEMR